MLIKHGRPQGGSGSCGRMWTRGW